MNTALWFVQGILAAVFIAAGVPKIVYSEEKAIAAKLIAPGFTLLQTRLIGIAEMIGAAGLILPGVTGIATVLVAVSAFALALIPAGGVAIHLPHPADRRDLVACVVLIALCGALVVLRLGYFPL
ncbi:DoxX family protein [Nocardia salmonicida]|uniref:DoxX family protein n=1 Tax=Nocardia salmonicida TaxID=53431 RepID=UPI00366EF60A